MSIQNDQVKLIVEYAESLAVPLFFCITGYLLEERLSHNRDAERKIIVASLMKYVRIYVVVSIIYIPITVYGTFQELRGSSNLYVTVYNLIKNYIFVGEQFYSWQLWYLLATIFGMAVLLLVPHKHWYELLLYSCAFFALAYVSNCFQGTRIIKLTIVNGRLFTGPSYILLGMLVKREHELLSQSGGIIAPILACFCSVLLKIPYSTTSIVAFLSMPWILGILMKYSKNCYQVGVSKECREISSIIYFSHMYFLFVWMYLLPIREKGAECFMFVSGTSFLFSVVFSLMKKKICSKTN